MAAERPLVTCVIGTRPEAIKLLPVIRALAELPGVDQQVILTGQHSGLGENLDLPDQIVLHRLGVDPSEQTAGEICEAIHHALCMRFRHDRASLVLVQGDTSSALAGALAARDHAIPFGHVEAGLRSFDLDDPWPEERNRVAIDRIADLLFAPTEVAAANLSREQLAGSIHVTGNSGIDALFQARRPAISLLSPSSDRRIILTTCHRRENRGLRLTRIAQAIARLPAELPVQVLFALHPNRHVRAEIEAQLGAAPHVQLLPPLDHAGMVALIDQCWLILTDSGGLQEEGPALGKPVLVLRETTERVEAGASSELVGTDPDCIVGAVASLLNDPARYARMAMPNLAYGDGRAATRIAAIIEGYLETRYEAAAA